jgi:uncharacterized protein (TIGR03437 family)
LIAELRNVGTFNPQAFNEVRQNGAPPLGADGFAPPSLLSLFAFPQTFFHNGSVNSLDAVLQNVAHRSAGTPGTDTLQDAAKRAQLARFVLSIDAATPPIAPNQAGTLSVTSAAANIGAKLAPDSLGSAYGTALAVQTASTSGASLPVTLAGSTISVQDSAGVLRLGGMSLASPGQINFLLPAATSNGKAQITVTSASGVTATASVDVSAVMPSIFSLGGSANVAAAVAIRVAEDGTQTPVAVFQCTASGCTASPIDRGGAGDSVFLTLFGTGLRKNSGLSNVRATIGGVDAPVAFAGAQGEFAGLDQINLQLPASLRGRGDVAIILTVDGVTTNSVNINVR